MRKTARVILLAAGAALTPVRAAEGQDFGKLAFMTGCWQGTLPDGSVVEEIWTRPAENLMLGLTRYLEKNRKRATNWEFTFVERTDSTVFFVPQTKTEKPDTFRVRILADEVAAWSREGDDFPASIMYRRTSDGAVIARLEAAPTSGERSFELRFERVKCPGQ